jgi:hypothetical protein
MKLKRIVAALVVAAFATPVWAEKCHVCDFSDEPIVVKGKKASTSPSKPTTETTATPRR